MSMGMAYDEFWYGDTERIHFYEKAQRLRDDHQNGMMLVQAVYTYRCFDAFRELIIQSKGAKIYPLNLEPFPLTMEQKKELDKKHEDEARIKMINVLMRK